MGDYYTVQQGDCLSSIAQNFGFPDYATIYRDPENAAFRKKRPNPNVICPGDILYIPDNKARRLTATALERVLTFGSTAGATALIYHP